MTTAYVTNLPSPFGRGVRGEGLSASRSYEKLNNPSGPSKIVPGSAQELRLKFGASFSDLYERDGIKRLDAEFVRYLADFDTVLRERLLFARANPAALAPKAE